MEIVLFGGFLLHMFYGVYVQLQNWFSRPKRYKIENFSQTSFFSKFMIHTAAIVTVFLVIHVADFYYKSRIAETSLQLNMMVKHIMIWDCLLWKSFSYPDM
jgi:succinate dehydrogenase / fumarate reductase cytochrome b subunit